MRLTAALVLLCACAPPPPVASGRVSLLLSATPAADIPADPDAGSLVRVLVRNSRGAPLAGRRVTLSLEGDRLLCAPAPCAGETGSGGAFTVRLASTSPGPKSVTAAVDGASAAAVLVFVPGPPDALASSLALTPARLAARAEAQLTLRLRDAFGNPIALAPVALSVDLPGATVTPAAASTDAAGELTARVRAPSAGLGQVSVRASRLLLQHELVVEARPPSPAFSTLVLSPAEVPADGAAQALVQVTLRDEGGAPLPGLPVELSASGTGNVLTPASGATGSDGVFTARLASTVAEVKLVLASAPPLSLQGQVRFDAELASAARSSFAPDQPRALADGRDGAVFILTLRRASGAPLPGADVAFSSPGPGGSLSIARGVTDSSGVLATRVTSSEIAMPRVVHAHATCAACGAGLDLDAQARFYLPWAASPGWARSEAGFSIAVDEAAPQVLLATDYHGVVRSTDGGGSWRRELAVNGISEAIYRVAFDADGVTAYASGFRGFWRSDGQDSGWSQVAKLPGNGYGLATAPGRVWLGENQLLISSDRGRIFTPATLYNDQQVLAVAISRAAPQVIYASLLNGAVLVTSDGGATWSRAAAGDAQGWSVAADPLDASQAWQAGLHLLFHSADQGRSWQRVAFPDDPLTQVAVSAQGVFVAAGHGLWLSRNGGATWTRGEGTPASGFYSVAIDPGNALRVYASGSDGFFVSHSAGE